MSKDAVCGMNVNEGQAAEKSDFKGHTYYFDSLSCKALFDADPGKYTGEEGANPSTGVNAHTGLGGHTGTEI